MRASTNAECVTIGVVAATELAKRVLDYCWSHNGTSLLRRLDAGVVSFKPDDARRYYRGTEWDVAVEFITENIARQIIARPPFGGELELYASEAEWFEREHYFPHRLLQPLVDLGPFPPLLPRADIALAEARAIAIDRLEELDGLEPTVAVSEKSVCAKRLDRMVAKCDEEAGVSPIDDFFALVLEEPDTVSAEEFSSFLRDLRANASESA